MPASQISLPLPQQINSSAQDVFDVLLVDWGTASTDRYPLSSASAGSDQESFPFTPKGVIIGPQSTIDRAWCSWNPQVITGNLAAFFPARHLSLDTPISFALPAGQGTLPETPPPLTQPITFAMQRSLLYVFPQIRNPSSTNERLETTLLPTNYKLADGTQVPFSIGTLGWVSPTLHLRFLAKDGLPPQAHKRMPFVYQGGASSGVDPDATYFVAALPMYWRKNIVINMVGDQDNMIFRIAALRGLAAAPTVPQETTEAQKTSGVANSSTLVRALGSAPSCCTRRVPPTPPT